MSSSVRPAGRRGCVTAARCPSVGNAARGGVAEVDLPDHRRRVRALARRRRRARALASVALRRLSPRLCAQRGDHLLPGGAAPWRRSAGGSGTERDQPDQVLEPASGRRFGVGQRLASAGTSTRSRNCARSSASTWHQSRRACRCAERRRRLGARLLQQAPQRLVVVALRLAVRAQHHVDQLAAAVGVAGAAEQVARPATCAGRRGSLSSAGASLRADQLAGARGRQHQRRHQPRARSRTPRSARSPSTGGARRDPAGTARTARPCCPGDVLHLALVAQQRQRPVPARAGPPRSPPPSRPAITWAMASERSASASSLQISAAFSTPKRCRQVSLNACASCCSSCRRCLQHRAHVARVVLARARARTRPPARDR